MAEIRLGDGTVLALKSAVETDWSGRDLSGLDTSGYTRMTLVNMEGSVLHGATLPTLFIACNFRKSDFRGADLRGANFNQCYTRRLIIDTTTKIGWHNRELMAEMVRQYADVMLPADNNGDEAAQRRIHYHKLAGLFACTRWMCWDRFIWYCSQEERTFIAALFKPYVEAERARGEVNAPPEILGEIDR